MKKKKNLNSPLIWRSRTENFNAEKHHMGEFKTSKSSHMRLISSKCLVKETEKIFSQCFWNEILIKISREKVFSHISKIFYAERLLEQLFPTLSLSGKINSIIWKREKKIYCRLSSKKLPSLNLFLSKNYEKKKNSVGTKPLFLG